MSTRIMIFSEKEFLIVAYCQLSIIHNIAYSYKTRDITTLPVVFDALSKSKNTITK